MVCCLYVQNQLSFGSSWWWPIKRIMRGRGDWSVEKKREWEGVETQSFGTFSICNHAFFFCKSRICCTAQQFTLPSWTYSLTLQDWEIYKLAAILESQKYKAMFVHMWVCVCERELCMSLWPADLGKGILFLSHPLRRRREETGRLISDQHN